jgi:hypothetical protein
MWGAIMGLVLRTEKNRDISKYVLSPASSYSPSSYSYSYSSSSSLSAIPHCGPYLQESSSSISEDLDCIVFSETCFLWDCDVNPMHTS